jgi:NAD(P)-dependent dehydrogenase (short-subunit alcohol dehydrogenase family)
MSSLQLQSGLRVLVTAGASGIGRTIIEVLSSQGARVHTCDIDRDKLATFTESFPEVSTSHTDVSDPKQVEALFDDVRSSLGGLDVLINNAGISGPTAKLEDTDIDAWYRTIDVNLNSAFLCARLAIPLLREGGRGRLINISSVAGRLGYPHRSAYACSKWALIGLTKSLAMELGPEGICVNAVLPGIVEGPRMREVIAARSLSQKMDYSEVEQEYLNNISLRRMVTACDVAAMVQFLCSPAGANISGQSLGVCGNVETLG